MRCDINDKEFQAWLKGYSEGINWVLTKIKTEVEK